MAHMIYRFRDIDKASRHNNLTLYKVGKSTGSQAFSLFKDSNLYITDT